MTGGGSENSRPVQLDSDMQTYSHIPQRLVYDLLLVRLALESCVILLRLVLVS